MKDIATTNLKTPSYVSSKEKKFNLKLYDYFK